MPRFELRAIASCCAGARSCSDCEVYLPGFMSEHNGSLLISQFFYDENIADIETAIEMCRNQALVKVEV